MSKLYYVKVFCLHHTAKCTQRLWRIGILVRGTQHIQDIFKNNLHQTGSTIHQYPTCTKAGHWVIRQSFKQQVEIIYKLEINTICTTLGNKLTFLNVANGKAVCRMSQNFSTFSFYKMLALQLCLRPSPFCVGHAQSRLSQNWFKSTTNQAQ